MQFVAYEAARRGVRLDTHGIARYGRRHHQWYIWAQLVPELAAAFPSYFRWHVWGFHTPPHPLLDRGYVPVRLYSPATHEEYGFWDPWTDTHHLMYPEDPQSASPQALLHLLA